MRVAEVVDLRVCQSWLVLGSLHRLASFVGFVSSVQYLVEVLKEFLRADSAVSELDLQVERSSWCWQ